MTETNCYWEVLEIGPRYPHPDSKGQCLRTSGQLPATHGKGSIAKMEEIASIERYSWWTLWNSQSKPNYLTYKHGQLTPVGKAYLDPSNSDVDCEFPGSKILASSTDVTLRLGASLIECGEGGPSMIKDLGKGGEAVFDVSVPSEGGYAVNVAYVTAVTRDLNVKVNNGPIVTFSFVSSGEW